MSDGGLARLLTTHLPEADWQRIESAGVGRGIPDLNGCRDAVEVWIECKRTAGWVLDKRNRRRAQVAWHERRLRAGGRVFVAVRQTGLRRDDLWLYTGAALRDLVDGCRLDAAAPLLGHWAWGAWDWAAVRVLLFTPD